MLITLGKKPPTFIRNPSLSTVRSCDMAGVGTTPCAPLEKGNALVAYGLVAMKTNNQKKKETDITN